MSLCDCMHSMHGPRYNAVTELWGRAQPINVEQIVSYLKWMCRIFYGIWYQVYLLLRESLRVAGLLHKWMPKPSQYRTHLLIWQPAFDDISVMYPVHLRRSTNVSILLGVTVARINRSQPLLTKKCLRILLPHLFFERSLIVVAVNEISVWIVRF